MLKPFGFLSSLTAVNLLKCAPFTDLPQLHLNILITCWRSLRQLWLMMTSQQTCKGWPNVGNLLAHRCWLPTSGQRWPNTCSPTCPSLDNVNSLKLRHAVPLVLHAILANLFFKNLVFERNTAFKFERIYFRAANTLCGTACHTWLIVV